ncbi:MAG: type Z 30S ribosomal protein S14 [Candidatus Gracilibacteria bacterium]|jgi:small subunit ribosomal protein S14
MAKKSLKIKCERRKNTYLKALSKGKKPKFATRVYNRCKLCGRVRGYMGRFEVCRICFKELAQKGEVMGVRKSSW